MPVQLTFQQTRVLSYVIRIQRGQGYSPSVREIGTVLGLRSPSTVHHHLRELERKGWIRRVSNRQITILESLPTLEGA